MSFGNSTRSSRQWHHARLQTRTFFEILAINPARDVALKLNARKTLSKSAAGAAVSKKSTPRSAVRGSQSHHCRPVVQEQNKRSSGEAFTQEQKRRMMRPTFQRPTQFGQGPHVRLIQQFQQKEYILLPAVCEPQSHLPDGCFERKQIKRRTTCNATPPRIGIEKPICFYYHHCRPVVQE